MGWYKSKEHGNSLVPEGVETASLEKRPLNQKNK